MRYICPECGKEIPEDQVFCFHCGRKRDNTIRLDDKGNFVEAGKNKCVSCGAEIEKEFRFCNKCGQPISRTQEDAFKPQMVKNGWIGFVLALVPGALGFIPEISGVVLFSIFGLGHLYFKKWSRGGVFLLITAMLYYVRFYGFGSYDSFFTQLFMIVIIGFFFILQLMEVYTLAYMPHKAKR